MAVVYTVDYRSEVSPVDVASMALALRTIRNSPTKAPGGPVVIRVATRNHQLQSFWSAPMPTMAMSARCRRSAIMGHF